MYVYNVKNLSETAMKAVMRNLLKDYSEDDARKMMIEKYPHLEGDIVNLDMNEEDTPDTVKNPAPVSFEPVDDTFDEEAELDVKGLEDTDLEEEDETDRLIKAVESAIEAAEQPVKPVKVTKTKPAKTETKSAKTATKSAQVADKGESKAARARDMYANATDKSRKTMIAMYMNELGLSAAAASTYYYSAKAKCGD